jgi:hypothetical protein
MLMICAEYVSSWKPYRLIPCSPVKAWFPDDSILVFGKHGEVYAIYLPTGGSINVNLPGGGTTYNVFWFDPRTGAKNEVEKVNGGDQRSFSAPDAQDWVLLLRSSSGAPGGGLTYFLPIVSGSSN